MICDPNSQPKEMIVALVTFKWRCGVEHAGLALPTTPQNELGCVYCSKMLPRRSRSEVCKVSLIASFIIERNISLPSACFLDFFLYPRVGVPCELFIGFTCHSSCGKAIHDSYVHYPSYTFSGRVANSVNHGSPVPPSLPSSQCVSGCLFMRHSASI